MDASVARSLGSLSAQEGSALLSTLFSHSPEGMVFITPDFVIKVANESYAAQVGIPLDEILGHTTEELFPGWTQEFGQIFRQVKETGKPFHLEGRPSRLQRQMDPGTVRWKATISLMQGPEDTFLGYLLQQAEVTDRRREDEEVLWQANEATARILESITDAFFSLDLEWRFTYVNAEAEKLLQKTRDQLLGRVIWEEFPEAVGSTFYQQYHRAIAEQVSVAFEEFYLPLATWFHVHAYPSADGVSVYFQDVTDRKRAEESLRESEEKYRTLYSSIDVGYCIIEMVFEAGGMPIDYRFIEVNPAFERQTGLHEAEGRLMSDLVPGHEALWFETYGRVALTGEPVRFVNEAKGLNRWYDVYAFRFGEGESGRVAVLFSDITGRKRAEAERERLLAELDATISSIADGVMVYNTRGDLLRMNEETARIFRYDYSAHEKGLQERLGELELLTFNGEPFPYEDTPLANALNGLVTRDREILVKHATGELIYTSISAAPVLSNGEMIGVVAMVRDVTQQFLLRAQAEAARDLAEKAVKVRDEFISVAAHELKTPVTSLQGFSQLLMREAEKHSGQLDSSMVQRSAGRIVEQSKRLTKASQEQLLNLSRLETGKLVLRRRRQMWQRS